MQKKQQQQVKNWFFSDKKTYLPTTLKLGVLSDIITIFIREYPESKEQTSPLTYLI